MNINLKQVESGTRGDSSSFNPSSETLLVRNLIKSGGEHLIHSSHSPSSFLYQTTTQIEEDQDGDDGEDENEVISCPHFPVNVSTIERRDCIKRRDFIEEELQSDCPECFRNQRGGRLPSDTLHGNTCHNFPPPSLPSSESVTRRKRRSTNRISEERNEDRREGTRSERRKKKKENDGKDSSCPASEEMLKILRYLIWRQDLEDQHNRIVHEWRLLALAIDKILFWVFLVITVISSLSFLVIIPIQRRGFGFGFA